jgi:hypothetical protein
MHAASATLNSAFWMKGKGGKKFIAEAKKMMQEIYREFNLHVDD